MSQCVFVTLPWHILLHGKGAARSSRTAIVHFAARQRVWKPLQEGRDSLVWLLFLVPAVSQPLLSRVRSLEVCCQQNPVDGDGGGVSVCRTPLMAAAAHLVVLFVFAKCKHKSCIATVFAFVVCGVERGQQGGMPLLLLNESATCLT